MEEHRIGGTYRVNNKTVKLVDGDNCEDCILNNTPECKQMPECDPHGGHYVAAFVEIPNDEDGLHPIEKELLDRFGFTKDGAIDCKAQLKIFSFMDWYKNRYLKI